MARMALNLETLKSFDLGKVYAMFEHELKAAVMDLRDRPALKTARKVTLTVRLIPQEAETGDCEVAMLRFDAACALPRRASRVYEAGVQKDGGLIVNDLSPDDAHQRTLDEVPGFDDEKADDTKE